MKTEAPSKTLVPINQNVWRHNPAGNFTRMKISYFFDLPQILQDMEFTLIAIRVSINTFLTLIFRRHALLVSNVGYYFSFRDDKKISDYRQTEKRQQDYRYTDVRNRDKNQFLNDIYRAYHAQH